MLQVVLHHLPCKKAHLDQTCCASALRKTILKAMRKNARPSAIIVGRLGTKRDAIQKPGNFPKKANSACHQYYCHGGMSLCLYKRIMQNTELV